MEDNENFAKARIDNPASIEKKDKVDTFGVNVELVKSYDGLSHNFKRRMARSLNKAFTGVDDTSSKQLFPEMDMGIDNHGHSNILFMSTHFSPGCACGNAC